MPLNWDEFDIWDGSNGVMISHTWKDEHPFASYLGVHWGTWFFDASGSYY